MSSVTEKIHHPLKKVTVRIRGIDMEGLCFAQILRVVEPRTIITNGSSAIIYIGGTTLATSRIAERKERDKQARRAQIISAARRIAELEGWPNVTVRRLSDEISYSQPVLYAHFGSREGILAAVAVEGFGELGVALEKARKRVKGGSAVESIAAAYLQFAAASPALYEVMFSLNLSVPFGQAETPPELRFGFAQISEPFQGQGAKTEVVTELFWASLHGIADLTRTKRLPTSRQKERVKRLVELFTFPG